MFDGLEQRPAGQRRLLRLADRLDRIDPKRFALEHWVSSGSCVPSLDDDEQPSCGTVCCAVGYAAMLPEFKAEGFSLASEDDHAFPTYVVDRPGFFPAYYDGYRAVAKFFEITGEDAEMLFWDWWRYRLKKTKPSEVAARIREFVAASTKELSHV